VLYSQLEDKQEGEYEETSQPEYEGQECHLGHELEDIEMNNGNMSGHDWDENMSLHEFTIPFLHSLSPEPGPSHVSRRPGVHAVFQTVAQETNSELSEDEHEEIQDKNYKDTYVHFKPDVKSDSVDSGTEGDICYQLQDERLHLAEEAWALEEQQELDNLGTYLFVPPVD
jgi:hypothetical protein